MEFFALLFLFLIFVFTVFEDQIRSLLDALVERTRGGNQTTRIFDQMPTVDDFKVNKKVEYRKIKASGETPSFRRREDDGRWEDITPEEWEQATGEINEDIFSHWRDEYAEERQQRDEPERKYGQPGPTM